MQGRHSSQGRKIHEAVLSWPGVTAHLHRFGGTEYRLGKRELGHIHGDQLLDIPFPKKVRDEIIAAGRAEPHHILPDSGWIQIANFVLAGIFYILAGIGLRRQLTTGIGSIWAPRLFTLFGIALIIGGVFTADPGLGFPPGAPEGPPAEMSWHGVIHGFAPVVGFMSLTVALFILARRFGSQGQQSRKYSTIVAAVAMFVLSAIPNFTADWEKGVFNFLPLWAGTILGFGWTSLVIAKLKQEQEATSAAQLRVA